jgi:predicted TIM-barrel fold metal-dependent hydrolase
MALLLKEMDQAGVDKGVVVGRLAGTLGSVSNDDVAAILSEFPDRFIGAASIDPTHRAAAFATIDNAIKSGFKLINIEPGAYPVPMYADDRKLYPIYGHCEDKCIPIILMVGGTAGPDLSYSDPIRTDRVLADFPRLQVVVAHGAWPWVTQILLHFVVLIYGFPRTCISRACQAGRSTSTLQTRFCRNACFTQALFPFAQCWGTKNGLKSYLSSRKICRR